MNRPPHAVLLLDTYIGAALSASNDLVANLCDPLSDLGLHDDERRLLLLLWISDGVSEPNIAEQLYTADIEPTLHGLERRGLIVRAASDAGPSVWLTAEGRALWTFCGTEEMGRRLGRLQREIVALRDVLQRTVGLLTEQEGSSGTVVAVA